MCYLCQNALFFAYLIQVPVIIDIKNWFVVLKTRSEFDKFVNWRWYLNDLDYITFQYHVIQGSKYSCLGLAKSHYEYEITCPGAQFV